ncbi:MAG: Chitin binding protein [Acidimicrobiaceae bacterium]|nr:Chitin binding protein [Acidimicrobiaceae bacterium]
MQYLAFLRAPAKSTTDPRVGFLERWALLEGTFWIGNRHNPLDTEMGARGAKLWNPQGVRNYRTLAQGFRATLATMRQPIDRPVLDALRDRRSTLAELALALADSDWTGYGPRSWIEQGYASRVSGLPIKSFGLKQPTVSLEGVLVDPLGKPLVGVCVSVLSSKAPARGVLTGAGGTFDIAGLPHAPYVLEVVDCHHGARAPTPVYYDNRAAPAYTTTVRSRATGFSAICSEEALCPDVQYHLRHTIHFGTITPTITWSTPAPITVGTPLSSAQLHASSTIPGSFTYRPALGAHLAPGVHSLEAIFRPENLPGLLTTKAKVTIVVKRLTPKLTWTAPAPIAFGSRLSAVQLDASSTVPGTFAYSPPRGARLAPGVHVLGVTFRPSDGRDYALASSTVAIRVGRITPVITWPTPASVTAGQPLTAAQLDATAPVPGSFTYSVPAGTVLGAGTQVVVARFAPRDRATYTSATASVTLTVVAPSSG